MKIFFTARFRKSYKHLVSKNEKLKKAATERLLLFEKNPKNPSLKEHALHGSLEGYRSFSIGYDLRAVYRKEKDVHVFFDIGTHDAVYR